VRSSEPTKEDKMEEVNQPEEVSVSLYSVL